MCVCSSAERECLFAAQVNFPVPGEKVIDKVHFICNNLTPNTLEVKVKELKAHVAEEYFPWFANYIVVKRAAQEANFHHVYVGIIEKLDHKGLREDMVRDADEVVDHQIRSIMARA